MSFHCYPEQNDDVLFTKEDKGLHNYDESGRAEEMKRFRQISKSRILLDKIYKDAQVHTIFLSQCAEYQDKEVDAIKISEECRKIYSKNIMIQKYKNLYDKKTN